MGFTGFGDDMRVFLGELAAHNDRAWFERNKDRYHAVVLEPEKDFVVAMGEALRSMRPDIEAQPRVNGSIFRINRDTRFSKDKTPYKTHADMMFWEGSDRKESSAFFVRIVPEEIWIGAGSHMVSPQGLELLRAAIAAPASGEELVRIVERLTRAGYEVGDVGYKRVPRGYPADHPREQLLRHRNMHAFRREPIPAQFTTPEFVDWCMERFEELEPFHAWLVDVLG